MIKISPSKLAQALVEVIEDSKEPRETIRQFLSFLMKRKQLKNLPKIVRAFEREWRKKQGIVAVSVRSPKAFESIMKNFISSFSERFGERVDYTFIPEDQLIGGFELQYNDHLFDTALSSQLTRLSQKLRYG